MKRINEIIIVEGKSDKQFLETFLNCDILICNGSAVDGFDKDYLIELAKKRDIIILTDPDYPGERIRKEISDIIPNAKHAFVRKEYSIARHKVGVAEATKEEVLRALDNVITFNNNKKGTLSLSDMMNLHLASTNSKENKKKVIDHYHLGYCNTKTLLNRLNLLNVSYEELKKVLNDKH